jgi:hypothetical protein
LQLLIQVWIEATSSRTERRGGVIEHHVDVQVRRNAAMDQLQEAAELLGAVAGCHAGDYLAGGDVERGVEVRGAVASWITTTFAAKPNMPAN